jgi:hypothetical protein
VIDSFITKLRLLEASLAVALETHNETKLEYFREHDSLLQEIDALRDQYAVYKDDFFQGYTAGNVVGCRKTRSRQRIEIKQTYHEKNISSLRLFEELVSSCHKH